MRDRGGADAGKEKVGEKAVKKREKKRKRWRSSKTKCVHLCVCIRTKERSWEEKGGVASEGEREILTDFAVGIGGFSVGTEVRIPPSRSTVCYFKQSPLEPTLLSSERVFITHSALPTPPPNTNTREVLWAPSHTLSNFQKKTHRVYSFYVWEGGQRGWWWGCREWTQKLIVNRVLYCG